MTTRAKPSAASLAVHRKRMHDDLVSRGALSRDSKGVVSIADSDNDLSKSISLGVFDRVAPRARERDKLPGQSAGKLFEEACADYLRSTFCSMQHLRPGRWQVSRAASDGIAEFEQYEHLSELATLARASALLAGVLGTDYVIKPDVVIARHPEPDEHINHHGRVVDDHVALRTGLREKNNKKLLLHASVSTKWTLRSDRAQNARTEALNLIRNRKGRLPHVVVVTAEPLPSRLAALALGTGDIDCVYHAFLDELRAVLEEHSLARRESGSFDMLEMMIEGRRLKDISDLPLDLAV
jgi:hypothetical protein